MTPYQNNLKTKILEKKYERVWVKHISFLGFGLGLFGLFAYLSGVEGFSRLRHLQLIPLGGALLATLGITGSIAVRWGTLANAVGGKRVARWLDYYHYFIINRVLGFVLPKDITDLVGRSVWLKQSHGLSLSRAGASVVLDRLFDAMTLTMFLVASLPYWLRWVNAAVGIVLMVGFCIVVGFLLFSRHKPLLSGVEWLMNGALWLIYRVPWFRKRPSNLVLNLNLIDRSVVLRAYLFSVTKFVCVAGRMVFFAVALTVPISPMLLVLCTPVGQLTYLFAFTPGGLGIFEAGWIGILSLGGVKMEHAMTFVVGQRILTIIMIAILAILSQIIYVSRRCLSQSIQSKTNT